MKTINEIRQGNLLQLIEETGSVAKFSDRVNKATSLISQIKNGRSFGNTLARDIEISLNLPEGWMDNVHRALNHSTIDEVVEQLHTEIKKLKLTIDEKEVLTRYRKLAQNEKDLLLKFMRSLEDGNT